MNEFDQQKEQLRQRILQQRSQLDPSYRKQATQQIMTNLLTLPQYLTSRCLLTYVGVKTEIATTDLINHAMNQAKMVTLPRIYPHHQMQARSFRDWQALRTNRYGLWEPQRSAQIVPLSELDLIVMPCLTCNLQGDRLGYGGVYYDRYLARKTRHNLVVILCFAELLTRHIPVLPHDQVADLIITENRVF